MSAIDVVIRALILLGLAWLTAAALHRRSASVRALVWTTALGAVLLLPLLLHLTPAWRVEIASDPPMTGPAVQTAALVTNAPADLELTSHSTSSVAAAIEPMRAAAARAPFDWSRTGLIFSLAITLGLLVRLAAGHHRLSRLAAAARPVDDANCLDSVGSIGRELGVRGPIAVRTSEALSIPAVAGLLRPTVLLPIDAHEWTPEVRRAVLLHELAHVARRDALAQLICQIACAVYWCVPIVWHAARRAAALRERASDDVVLEAGVPPATYADALVRLARRASGAEAPATALAMARPSRLRERIIAILDPAIRRRAPGTRASAAVIALVTVLAATLAAVEPTLIPAPLRTEVIVENAPAEAPPRAPLAIGRRPTLPAPQASPRLCTSGIKSSSASITDNDGVRKWKVSLSSPECTIDVRAEGRFEFTADFTDIRTIQSGGFFRVDVTDRGVRRQLDIEPRNGSLTRTWRVGGRETPYDDAARAWFAAFLIELDRRTAIGVEVRLPYLLKQGGVDAVLAETALMSSDYARSRYYSQLARQATLSSGDIARVLRQAASLVESDHYAHELLRALAPRGLGDATQREAVIALIEGMDSDHYRASSIEAFLDAARPGAAEMDLLVRMVPRMESDHYKHQTLTRVLRAGAITPDQQASLTRVAATIESDHYAAEFLKALAATRPMPAAVRDAFVDAVGRIESDHYAAEVLETLISAASDTVDAAGILRLVPSLQSDHYRAQVLSSLLSVPQLRERDLIAIVAAAAPMSDHYESTTLRLVAGHRGATESVRTAVLEAADRLSSHYAETVRRAVRR